MKHKVGRFGGNLKQKILFTVVTPVFNGEKYLQETIDSVLFNIDFMNTEYIVVDDGSTDRTAEILRDYQNKIRVISKANQGQAKAINEGLKLAKGEFALIVNADDPLVSKKLFSISHEIFRTDPSIVVTYPNWTVINQSGNFIKCVQPKEYSFRELLGNFNCLVGPGGVFRIKNALQIGGWNSSYRFVPDYDFWLRMSTQGKFRKIPENLAVWRSHESSLSVGGRSLEMAQERIRVIENFLLKYPQDKIISENALSNAYFRASLLVFFDSRVPARIYLKRSFQHSKRTILNKNKFVLIYLLLSPLTVRITNKEIFRKFLIRFSNFMDLT